MGVNNSDFEYMAHRRGDTQKDMFYIGAYMGYVDNNKLRSLSGKTPTNGRSLSYSQFRTYVQNNGKPNGNGGSGYDLFAWYQLIYLQCMYVLKYKNLNSQTTIGNGYGSGTTDPAFGGWGGLNTGAGGTDTKGMDWGTTADYKTHVKCFGIEDLWGHCWQVIEGIILKDDFHIYTATENFNDSWTGYIDKGSLGITSNVSGWTTKVAGTTHGGFTGITASGSATTYYCDQHVTQQSRWLEVGGSWNCGSTCGIFCLWFDMTISSNTLGDYSRTLHMMYL